MKKFYPFRQWRKRLSLFRFFTILCGVTMFIGNTANSQTVASCGNVNCTSNDVRVISAYLSGPGNTPIDCGLAQPFINAELHLIVSSNTQRIGVSISGTLNAGANEILFANCFTGNVLNNGGNNDLVLPISLPGVSCGPPDFFSLTNLFISWGTGNTDFCDGSNAGHCPQTPAKCRYKPGEVIVVDVKLEVDFSFLAGLCAEGGNSLSYDFTPTVLAENITYPLAYHWDFGDGETADFSQATLADPIPGAQHTFAGEGTYTVTLTVTDATTGTPYTKSSIHTIIPVACCNLSVPTVGVVDNCDGTSTLTVTGLADGATVTWSDDVTNHDNPRIVTSEGTYKVTQSAGDCTSAEGSGAAAPKTAPGKPVITPVYNCDGTVTLSTDAAGTLLWSTTETTSSISVTSAGTYTVTATVNSCTSDAESIDVTTPKTRPANPEGTNQTACSPASLTATATGSNVTWYDADGNSVASPTLSTVGSVTYYAEASSDGCTSAGRTAITLTINPTPSCTISNTTTAGSHTAVLGAAVSFSGPSGANFKYAWSFTSNTSGASFAGGTTTATTQSVTVTTTTTGSYTLSLKVTDETYASKCNSTCTYAMSATPAGPYYTVTQGFYGNVGGKVTVPSVSCSTFVAGSKGNVDGLIATSIKNMPNKQLILGIAANNRTFTMGTFGAGPTVTEDKNLVTYLPAGQTAAVITANTGSNNNTNMGAILPKLFNKKISSVLLGQTITLKLNVYIPGNTLGGFVLKTDYLTTQKADLSKCPTIKLIACSTDASSISSMQLTTSAGLKTWINTGTKTVNDLLNLASNALGGGALPAGVTLSDINNAVDVINRSFDGARYFLGYFPTAKSCSVPPAAKPAFVQTEPIITELAVSAYPNPFTDKVKFNIVSPVSGKASLDVYNLMGQKVANVYNGYLQAGRGQMIEYKTTGAKGTLIYSLKVGDKQVNGKVINLK